MKHIPIEVTRARLEAKIEELVALLDLFDGDENLEPYLADSDPEADDREDDDEREPEETDQNGDEQDCCHSEDEWRPFSGDLQFDGSGNSIARLGCSPQATEST
ncbi:hypothetical protein PX860_07300 [Agrobacterium leguminum]|uniref:hypothetical protein n=1 Tax=Agrobacterium leguminum TaxID=2792015 RepID=UPI002729988F|nr:hypothetical protein [Agrobacterium leguminum]WLD98291.1 hypothetical protein PX860_07300 [Agrobacterium leguminum]